MRCCTILLPKFCFTMKLLYHSHYGRFPQLQFDYKDPERGFDRKSVHGLVVRLVTVKDASTATALEVSAGGKVSKGIHVKSTVRNSKDPKLY